jgi:hypothetical protein
MTKFSLKKFVMKTLTAMRDAGKDEYKVMQYALKYYEKSVLTDNDLAEVEGWFEVLEEEPSDSGELLEETEVIE